MDEWKELIVDIKLIATFNAKNYCFLNINLVSLFVNFYYDIYIIITYDMNFVL